MELANLGKTVQHLLDHSIAKSTSQSYTSSQKRYYSFCTTHNLTPFPTSQPILCLYIAFLFNQGLAHSSIKCYLSSVHHLQIAKGFPDPFMSSLPQLHMVLRGIKVCRGLEGRNTPSQKLPITPAILCKLRALWTPHCLEYHYIMLWAVCCTCFFGFFLFWWTHYPLS